MGKTFKNSDILNRILSFFFMITFMGMALFLLVTSGIQKNQSREQLTAHLSHLATALSTAISEEHISTVLEHQTANHPSYELLINQLKHLTNQHSSYFHTEIIDYQNGKTILVAPSPAGKGRDLELFAEFHPAQEYADALDESARTGQITSSKIYKSDDSSYLTVFAPIRTEDGQLLAFLAINGDLRYLQMNTREGNILSFLFFTLIMVAIYFFFKNGINKFVKPLIERNKGMEKLQLAEKMNAVGQLAASVAHEIRNPLTVVKGFLQIFLSKEKLTKEEHMYVRLMIDEMSRAETIINDYLSLAKPDMGSHETFPAKKMAYQVIDLIHSYAMLKKNIEIRTIIEDEFELNCNKNELQQVLINILKNGIEAMPDGGILSLKVGRDSQYGKFEVRDTGIGMTEDELKRLGTAFYSLKENGTGIGLMVCFQIISRMNGKIEVESKKGKGTVFRIKIPLY